MHVHHFPIRLSSHMLRLVRFARSATSPPRSVHVCKLRTGALIARTDFEHTSAVKKNPVPTEPPGDMCSQAGGRDRNLWNIFIWGSRKLTGTFHLHRSQRKDLRDIDRQLSHSAPVTRLVLHH